MQPGVFLMHKNSFLAGERKLVIKKRKKPSTKPELYLIQLEPFEYVSSLFPAGENEYTFDFKKKLYALKKEADKVEITELS